MRLWNTGIFFALKSLKSPARLDAASLDGTFPSTPQAPSNQDSEDFSYQGKRECIVDPWIREDEDRIVGKRDLPQLITSNTFV